jgi:hypothetical protein
MAVIETDKIEGRDAMKKRRLKVRDSYYEYQLKIEPRPAPVPYVELKGYWLRQAGFDIGKPLEVLLGVDHLVIRLAPEQESGSG